MYKCNNKIKEKIHITEHILLRVNIDERSFDDSLLEIIVKISNCTLGININSIENDQ